jgi:glucose-6-phosphate 1-dehydrogenase
MARKLVVFGASGDLTSRKLMPAIAELLEAGKLPRGCAILGVSRKNWSSHEFRRHVQTGLERHSALGSSATREALGSLVDYRAADVTNSDQVASAIGEGREAVVAYLALPPPLFAPAVKALASIGLPDHSVIARTSAWPIRPLLPVTRMTGRVGVNRFGV